MNDSTRNFIRRWCSAFDTFFPSGYFLTATVVVALYLAAVYGVVKLLAFLADTFPILREFPW